jgi:hypothetical protein
MRVMRSTRRDTVDGVRFTFRMPPSYKWCLHLVDSQDTGSERVAPPDPTSPSIDVDYGSYIRVSTGIPRLTKQALVLGNLEHDWQWDTNPPVHMVCHSQEATLFGCS